MRLQQRKLFQIRIGYFFLNCVYAVIPKDVGLPEHNIPLALFLFNAGMEIGQLVFVFTEQLVLFPPYFIGTFAMYWFIERVVSIL